jgi:hypothetical protein
MQKFGAFLLASDHQRLIIPVFRKAKCQPFQAINQRSHGQKKGFVCPSVIYFRSSQAMKMPSYSGKFFHFI